MENSMTSFERSRKPQCFLLTLTFAKRHTSKSSRYNAMMRYVSHSLHARLRLSRCMHELSSARFQSASWVKRCNFVRTFQKAAVFVGDLLTFWSRGVLADSYHYMQYVGVDAKRHTSKSSRYNAMIRYASYSLHARLRFSRCMNEHSTAIFQSASRVKMRDRVSFRERGKFHDVVRTFQKKKLYETGSNRFCTQTRLEKRAIIVSIKPKTIELGLLTLTLTPTGNWISTKGRWPMTFH